MSSETIDPLNLPAYLADIARDQLGETLEIRAAALNELRTKISELPEKDRLNDLSDLNLIRFLRLRKLNIEKALKQTIEYKQFYSRFGNELSELKKGEFLIFENFLSVLPFRDSAGRVIVVMHPKAGISIFTREFVQENPNAMLRFKVWMFDRLSFDPEVQVCGILLFNTFSKLTLWDQMAMSNMAPISHQLATFQFFQILGFRLGGAYIFDQPSFFNLVWALARPFMSEKIRSRFHLCGSNYEVLKSVVANTELLPTFLGGNVEQLGNNWIAQQQ